MANASLQAKTGSGLLFYVGTGTDPETAVWTHVEGMVSGTLPSPDKPEIDVSDTESEVREYIPGLGSIPDLSVQMNFFPKNPTHQRLASDILASNVVRPWKIEGNNISYKFLGYLKSFNIAYGIDAAMNGPLVLKVTSKPIRKFSGDKGTIAWDSSLAGNNSTGAVTGSLIATLTAENASGATFTSTVTNDSALEEGMFVTANIPEGLTVVAKKTSPTVVTVTFTGTATDKADTSSVAFAFLDAAFSNATTSDISQTSRGDIAITFA